MTPDFADSTRFVSKSRFLLGLQCPKLLWSVYNSMHLIPAIDDPQQAVFDQGKQVGNLAKQLFSGCIEINGNVDADDFDYAFGRTLAESQQALALRRPLFEAAFVYNGGFARVDILNPVGDDEWDLIEVKSTTSVQEIHLHDLAFQAYVLTGAGLKVKRCILAHINPNFVKNRQIDPKQFFVLEDVTAQVATSSRSIEPKLDEMFSTIRLPASPEIQIGKHCGDPYPCPLYDRCWSFLPEMNVTTLYRGGAKAFKLLASGLTQLKGIPDDFKLTDNQAIQRRTAISGEPHVDKPAITAFLKQLKYPLSYLDFETIGTAIPIYDNSRPYQQVPFQFSLHIVQSEGAEPEHYKFLAEGTNDPRPEFMRRLRESLPCAGSIVTFNASFELSRLRECCDLLPEFKPWARIVSARVVDLLLPFRGFRYYHPKQNGSASMKAVLPTLTGKGYDQLIIQDGTTASLQFLRATFGNLSVEECAAIRKQLDEYCGLDTLGMVWIIDALRNLI
jgi:hypothetical protein